MSERKEEYNDVISDYHKIFHNPYTFVMRSSEVSRLSTQIILIYTFEKSIFYTLVGLLLKPHVDTTLGSKLVYVETPRDVRE